MVTKLISGLAISLLAAAGAQAAPMNISLDGFCNTFSLDSSNNIVFGTRSGCGYTVIDGGTVGKVNGNKVTVANDTNDGTLLFTWIFSKADGGVGTWSLYGSDGASSTLYNSGTYTLTGQAASKAGTKDVTAR
jgi:hypothetical protein